MNQVCHFCGHTWPSSLVISTQRGPVPLQDAICPRCKTVQPLRTDYSLLDRAVLLLAVVAFVAWLLS